MKRSLLFLSLLSIASCGVQITTEEEFNALKKENEDLSLQVHSLKLDTMFNGIDNRLRDRLEFISDSMLDEQFKNIK